MSVSREYFKYLDGNAPIAKPGVYVIIHESSGRAYVGISVNVRKRILGHQRGESPSKFNNALAKYGRSAFVAIPLYYSLTEDFSMLPQIEEDFINSYASSGSGGFNLRISGGPVGPYGPEFGTLISKRNTALWADPKRRLAQSVLSRARWEDPEYRGRMLAATAEAFARPEVRASLSRANVQKWSDPETREKMRAGIKAARLRPEVKAKYQTTEARERLRLQSVNRTPEAFAKSSAAMKLKWAEDGMREKWSASILRSWQGTERRATLSERMRKLFSDPAARETVSKKCAKWGWITDGISDKKYLIGSEIPEGWRSGKTKNETRGLLWITNGFDSRRVKPGSEVPDGWRYGSTQRRKSKAISEQRAA